MPVKGYLSPDVSHLTQVAWAKETLLQTIDDRLFETENAHEWKADEEEHLLRQRNRIARFLGLPLLKRLHRSDQE